MSTRQHASLLSAVTSAVKPEPAPIRDVTADTILRFKREIKEVVIEDLGRVYVYEPQSVTEREAYQKHMRIDETGVSISMMGMVDGILARVRDKNGALLFSSADRPALLNMPAERLMAIWAAIGGDSTKGLSKDLVEQTEKK